MTRLILALTVSISLVSPLSASLSPRKPGVFMGSEASRSRAWKVGSLVPAHAAEEKTPTDFVMTEQTELLLNGRPCKYADVPAQASIVFMEVAADKKTVLKIHFRASK